MKLNQKKSEQSRLVLEKRTIMQFPKQQQQQQHAGVDDKTSTYSTCPTMMDIFDTLLDTL